MTIDFKTMFKDEVTAHIIIENNKLIKAETYTNDNWKYPFIVKPIKLDFVLSYLKRRAIKENNPFIKEFMDEHNLKEYNVIDILKITHGVDIDDFSWIKFKGEDITWKDVKVRG